METHLECALLSDASYRDVRGDENIPFIPLGWEALNRAAFGLGPVPGDGGFSAEIYRKGDEIVIAFQGTNPDPFSADGIKDWGNNFGLYAGNPTSQLMQAAELYLRVATANPGADITFTGHSMGGGLAGLMSIFFNRSASAFAPAPFEPAATAANGQLIRQHLVSKGLAAPGSSAIQELDALLAGHFESMMIQRESQISGYAVVGEALDIARQGGTTLIGSFPPQPLIVGDSELGPVGRHSMQLHAALLKSNAFSNASVALPALLRLVADGALYSVPLKSRAKTDFLQRLLVVEFTGRPVSASGILDRFGLDMVKLAGTGAVALPALRDALIAAGIEYYYFVDPATTGAFFAADGNCVRFDLRDVALNGNPSLSLPRLVAGVADYLDRTLVGDFDLRRRLEQAPLWSVQAGAGALNTAGDVAAEVLIGGSAEDTLYGGAGDDVLIGGSGTDTLDGGANADMLIGGADPDTLTGGKDDDRLEGGAGLDSYCFRECYRGQVRLVSWRCPARQRETRPAGEASR